MPVISFRFHGYQHELPKNKKEHGVLLYLRSTQDALRLPNIT